MKPPQLVSQGSIDRMLKASEQAWKRKDWQESVQILERANRLAPANVLVLLRLGRIHGLNYDYAAAEACFEKAVRVSQTKTATLALAGECCRDFRNLDLADRFFQRAAQARDVTPDILVEQAEFYERARRRDDASALVDRALGLNGACTAALLARARLDRLADRLDSAESAVRSLLSQANPGLQPGRGRDLWIRGLYELGTILDRQARFDEAMAAWLEAKSMLRLHAGAQIHQLTVIRDRLSRFRDSLSAEMLQRWFDGGAQLGPARRLVLLGGHPRSGTTLLEQVLDSHPDILSAEETEIFQDESCAPLSRGLPPDAPMLNILDAAPADALRQSRERYFKAMELSLGKPVGDRLLIDKNPSNTFLIAPMVRIFPEMKLLVALRDPRDVVLSCFMQPFVPLTSATTRFLSFQGAVDEYAALMTMWRTLKPLLKNPCLEVRYEDMVRDLEPVARRTLEFLGVPWDARVLQFHEHARQKAVRSPTYADVAKPVFKTAVGRWRNYQKHLEPHLAKLDPFVKAFGYG
jgi:tetratricopeptide (TPR) repeat protein